MEENEKVDILKRLNKIYTKLPEPTPPKKALVLQIAKKCNCSETTAYNWALGKTTPNDTLNLIKIKEIIEHYNDKK